jgi:uncharacterized heparinase superfamily protein
MSSVARLGLYLETARHLRVSQVAWRLVHEARFRAYQRAPEFFGRRWRSRVGLVLQPSRLEVPPAHMLTRERAIGEQWRAGEVSYHSIAGPRDDWRCTGRARLWRYERQYHSELVALAALAATEPENGWLEDARALVRSWMRACPPVTPDAWEPYPVARRLLNWSLAAGLAPALGVELAPTMDAQARFLAAHLEHHLRGNHLLCDAAALVAAGATLENGDRFLRVGERLLAHELRAQVLGDGGYAERTVQYHAIVLLDVLVAMGLAARRGRALDADIAATARRMAGWLNVVRRGDGTFPAQNDAAHQATPPIEQVLALAQVVADADGPWDGWLARSFGGRLAQRAADAERSDILLPDTGWVFARERGHELLFDAGPLGPDEQPGHGHSDALAFELVWDRKPVVVDTGVSTYERGAVRAFERSARAHATVTVAGEGPDELWAAFRVGRRGRVFGSNPIVHGPVRVLHGVLRAPRGWEHHRQLVWWPGRALVVVDRIENARTAEVVARLPLAPALSLVGTTVMGLDSPLVLDVLRGELLESVTGGTGPREGWVAEGFEQATARTSVRVRADREGQIFYALRAEDVKVVVEGSWCTIRASERVERVALDERGVR